ncbi:energy transducer TonB [Maribacter algarum]|uniref:Energy transducer TonB n=1 Tax=Maribacter algarum (ex Zhang et al. 2020) TaxID=2578118 RepID=A0A5S3PUJ7_9FLAO|nr:energy transducer TonB [Maribacter algarum]TMM56360.1 energy transducer TonB [Maribacter algarum]
MEVKKNPKKDLNKSSGVFFAAGLAMVLALTYVALEWKTFYGTEFINVAQNVDEELIEELELFEIEQPKPPEQQAAPEVIEVVEDEVEVEESVIESTESDEDTEVMEVEDVQFEEEPVDVEVPFAVIENVPVFPGCENEKDKRACFNTMMQKHIVKNFRYPEIAQEMGVQGRVSVMFTIQKDGSIGNVRMRGPDKNLEKEAARIIGKLPKMTPGNQRGTPVRVPFAIPITFKLSN